KYDSDDETIVDDDSPLTRDSKMVKFSTTSMRTDMILKSALGVARNKIEQAFYESKIRVNGRKITKKSAPNPDHLFVSRIEILDASPKEESIGISARRFKNLLIENYEEDPHKGGSSENN
ncbi:putative secreted protein, partial [Operophtera brumata]